MEVTLRRYEKPVGLEERELIRKFCLGVGLLQPGDSRDVVVDVLLALMTAKRQRQMLSSEDINEKVIELRKKYNLQMLGIAPSNVRRQIKRLRELLLVEKIKSKYRIIEFGTLMGQYDEKFSQFLLPTIVTRIKEYFTEIDNRFG
jgi:predicted transcriptional regulator